MKHQTQKITEHVMRLWSDAQQNGYLITGKSRAALITKDESEADKQLKSVWELTGKPVTVLLSDGRLGSSGAGADAELCGGMVFDLDDDSELIGIGCLYGRCYSSSWYHAEP